LGGRRAGGGDVVKELVRKGIIGKCTLSGSRKRGIPKVAGSRRNKKQICDIA